MTLKSILAAIAGAIAAFLLGWLVFAMLMGKFYDMHTVSYTGLLKTPPNMIAIFLFNLSWSALLTLVFSKWANVTTFGRGVIIGMQIGFLTVVTYDLMTYAFMHLYDHTLMVVDVLLNTVFWGVIGGIIGMILGVGNKEAATA